MSGQAARTLTVALLQGRPDLSDSAMCLERLSDMASDAKRKGAQLVAAGETWLPGYPAWIDHCPGAMLWDDPTAKEAFAAYRRQCVTIPGPEHNRLSTLAADLGIVLVVGASERVDDGLGSRSLYNALLTYDADGRLVNHHRKLVPTFTERCIHAPGDGNGLVVPATAVGRVGGLICWEHWMPLARQTLHDQAEAVHVAVWPTVHERHQIASRHYAFEGRCFVLAVGQVLRDEDLPAGLDRVAQTPELVLRGGSCVIGPDGEYLTKPRYDDEAVIVAELDLGAIDRESQTLDVSGHYARPDVFEMRVDHTRR